MNKITVNYDLLNPKLQGNIFCVDVGKEQTFICKSINVYGSSKLVYRFDENVGRKIAWLETDTKLNLIQKI